MEQRRLGRTGLSVGMVGFGGLVAADRPQQEVDELVGRALDAGVTYFDTAHSYGDSQEKLGVALQGKHGQVVLGAKVIYRGAGEAAREVDASLRRLRTDYIDVYHLHAVDTPEEWKQVSAEDGALTALESARRAGKVGFLGITGHMPTVLVLALKSGRLDTVMTMTNYVDRFVYGTEVALHPLARERDAGVLVLKPTAHGQLADREVAYRYVLSQDVDCVLPPRQQAEFLLALRAAERFQPLSPEEERDLLLRAPELKGRCRQCGFCLPCPEGLDVPFLLRLAGWFARFGQTREIARRTYRELPVQADRCTALRPAQGGLSLPKPGCGVCEERCPYDVPIIEDLKQAHLTLASATR
jgi:hypothetical protein